MGCGQSSAVVTTDEKKQDSNGLQMVAMHTIFLSSFHDQSERQSDGAAHLCRSCESRPDGCLPSVDESERKVDSPKNQPASADFRVRKRPYKHRRVVSSNSILAVKDIPKSKFFKESVEKTVLVKNPSTLASITQHQKEKAIESLRNQYYRYASKAKMITTPGGKTHLTSIVQVSSSLNEPIDPELQPPTNKKEQIQIFEKVKTKDSVQDFLQAYPGIYKRRINNQSLIQGILELSVDSKDVGMNQLLSSRELNLNNKLAGSAYRINNFQSAHVLPQSKPDRSSLMQILNDIVPARNSSSGIENRGIPLAGNSRASVRIRDVQRAQTAFQKH